MPVKYYYYYKPKVVFASVGLFAFLGGSITGMVSASDTGTSTICCILSIILSIVCFFLVTDGLIPAIQNKAVMIVDENGITDVISWGLIKWANIRTIDAVKAKSQGSGGYSFTELHIVLKDLNQYEYYNKSWWIRFKVKFLNFFKSVDIVMDIDALKGEASDVFREITERYLFFGDTENRRHNH